MINNSERLGKYLDELDYFLSIEEEFYNLSLLFDNIVDLRQAIKIDYENNLNNYNKGRKNYYVMLDKEEENAKL